jgi:hypothetical protein
MSFATKNDYITGRKPIVSPSGAEVCAVRFAQAVAAGEMALNALDNIGILPAGCVPVAVLVDSDDLDTNGTPTIQWAFGVSNAAVTNNVQGQTPTDISTATADGGAAWATGVTISQAGGQVDAVSKALSRVQAVNYDRYIVAKATTAAATGAAGELGLTLLYRPA